MADGTMKLVLYADDDSDDRELLDAGFLAHPDYTLLTFTDGQKLLTHLIQSNKNVCLVVLDVNMPKLNGMETLAAIRKDSELTQLPVVMFTTSNNPADKLHAADLQAIVITKATSEQQQKALLVQMLDYCTGSFKIKA